MSELRDRGGALAKVTKERGTEGVESECVDVRVVEVAEVVYEKEVEMGEGREGGSIEVVGGRVGVGMVEVEGGFGASFIFVSFCGTGGCCKAGGDRCLVGLGGLGEVPCAECCLGEGFILAGLGGLGGVIDLGGLGEVICAKGCLVEVVFLVGLGGLGDVVGGLGGLAEVACVRGCGDLECTDD